MFWMFMGSVSSHLNFCFQISCMMTRARTTKGEISPRGSKIAADAEQMCRLFHSPSGTSLMSETFLNFDAYVNTSPSSTE